MNLFEGFTSEDLSSESKPRVLREGYYFCSIKDLQFTESKGGNMMLAFQLTPFADPNDSGSALNTTLRYWHVFSPRGSLNDDALAAYNRRTRTLAAILDDGFRKADLSTLEATQQAQKIISQYVEDPSVAIGSTLVASVVHEKEGKYAGNPKVKFIATDLPTGQDFVDPSDVWA